MTKNPIAAAPQSWNAASDRSVCRGSLGHCHTDTSMHHPCQQGSAKVLVGFTTILNGWIWPSPYEAFLFVLLGLAGGVANLLLTQSYRLADASLVSPIKYLSLVIAVVAGYLIFSEVPKAMTLFGAVLIVLSSFIIFRREETLKKQVVAPRI